jgi:hypothetical protein
MDILDRIDEYLNEDKVDKKNPVTEDVEMGWDEDNDRELKARAVLNTKRWRKDVLIKRFANPKAWTWSSKRNAFMMDETYYNPEKKDWPDIRLQGQLVDPSTHHGESFEPYMGKWYAQISGKGLFVGPISGSLGYFDTSKDAMKALEDKLLSYY